MASLPSPRHLVASLISTISSKTSITESPAAVPTGNPLKDAPPTTQKALLTLHVLFPNELLPALDLLDRGLVTRFILSAPNQTRPHQAPSEADITDRKEAVVHYVRSAQPPSNRHRSAMTQHTTSYEVRLTSWSCSCPALAFAAFPADPASAALPSTGQLAHTSPGANWIFGGLTLGTDMPVCKHLLACVLVERCELFSSFAEEREVSVEELAGWAAGWGD